LKNLARPIGQDNVAGVHQLYGHRRSCVDQRCAKLRFISKSRIPLYAAFLRKCLVTLTAGVGGSLLSIGSAAGVALMGQARGIYTFVGHLKWTPVIALGYAASIGVHMAINHSLF